MMGSKLPNGEFTGTIPAMARKVGLQIKSMICSGSEDQEAINKLSGAVLSYKWDPKEDQLSIQLWFNISKRRKGKHESPDLTLADMEQLKTLKHTRRNLLGICKSLSHH